MSGSALESATAIHDPVRMRRAGRDLLSLALIDARNHTLRWLGAFDGQPLLVPSTDVDPPWWLVGQAAWFQEYWIGRHLQRTQGGAGDAARLASIEPRADDWFDPARRTRAQRWAESEPPSPDMLRDYLAATLDSTLELLDSADESDLGLYVYRAALAHEDRLGEALAAAAQVLRLPAAAQAGLWPDLPVRVMREPLWCPAQTLRLGTPEGGGWRPENETGMREERVPEFEIDAQLVSWAQFVEFAIDGGYDDEHWWTPAGWAWVQQGARRAPRDVEQCGEGGVLAQRQGRLQRLAASQPVLQVSAHEAEAWCAWAGRRLPTEAEWQAAAQSATGRGFVWGDGFEWMAGRARLFPGHQPAAAPLDRLPDAHAAPAEPLRVLRGASWMTPARQHHPLGRRFAEPARDEGFFGFRSCAF